MKYKRVLPPIDKPTPYVYDHEKYMEELRKMAEYFKNLKDDRNRIQIQKT